MSAYRGRNAITCIDVGVVEANTPYRKVDDANTVEQAQEFLTALPVTIGCFGMSAVVFEEQVWQ